MPAGCDVARAYTLGVLFENWLGVAFSLTQSTRVDACITFPELPGEIRLPDVFFAQFALLSEAWFSEASLPTQPLMQWDSQALAADIPLVDSTIPIIYGDPKTKVKIGEQRIDLPIDIFGSAFFMLSRYEEAVSPERDNHDRFPATASLAYQAGFLDRPIIDEYVEILWAAMQRLWPQLKRKQRNFEIKVSHDVDSPSHYGFRNVKSLIRAIGGDVIKRRDFKSMLFAPWVRLNTKKALHPQDPYNTFDWIMDVSEQQGLTSAFYFICGGNAPQDADYPPEHSAIRALMRRIHKRGHEIGLHPSYDTYQNPQAIAAEAQRLKQVCAEEGIEQAHWGGRMHYLRWEHPTTLYGWEQADMAYDSTLSYANRPGFRCGTCFEYPAFDPVRQKILKLRIRPLIAMECSVISERYMGLGYTEQALETFLKLKETCQKVNGQFTLLWHNSHFTNEQDKQFYQVAVS